MSRQAEIYRARQVVLTQHVHAPFHPLWLVKVNDGLTSTQAAFSVAELKKLRDVLNGLDL